MWTWIIGITIFIMICEFCDEGSKPKPKQTVAGKSFEYYFKTLVKTSSWSKCFTTTTQKEDRRKMPPIFMTHIAGARHHLPKLENFAVAFKGFAIYDEANNYNHRAVAIVDYKGLLYGYVPETDLEDYRKESKVVYPCVGYASLKDGELHTNVKIILSDDNMVISRAANAYVDWFRRAFGHKALVREPKEEYYGDCSDCSSFD